MSTSLRVALENVKKLVRRNAKIPLYKLINKLHPEDIAYIIQNLSDLDRKSFQGFITNKALLSEVVLSLDEQHIVSFFEETEAKVAGDILSGMESDDRAYILRVLPEGLLERVSQFVSVEELDEAEELLLFPEDTAGAMMNTAYIAFAEDTSVKEATKSIHKFEDIDMVYYIYVIDGEGRLTGVLSLRQLIVNPPEKTLAEIMTKSVMSVETGDNQQDVARLVAKYDFMALPVVNEQRVLLGIITFDDIIDLIKEEATEDIYRMTGTSEDFSHSDTVIKSAKGRLPWLVITLVGEMVSGGVIAFFQGRLTDFLVLASFMPTIMAMGGNVGTQSATIIIRNVAIGQIDPKRMFPILWKELRVGLLMGFVSAIPITVLAPFIHASPHIGIIVGAALFCAMSFAAFSGTFVPLLVMRIKFDPAVASGPFISTFNDITGLTIYFLVAMGLMAIL